jgi:hypothetical protein
MPRLIIHPQMSSPVPVGTRRSATKTSLTDLEANVRFGFVGPGVSSRDIQILSIEKAFIMC